MDHFQFSQKQSRFGVLFLCVLVVIALILTQTFQAKAEIALFDALSVRQHVNDSELRNTQASERLHEYVWSSFTGVVPLGAVVESMTFTLSWIQSITIEDVEHSERERNEESVEMKTESVPPPVREANTDEALYRETNIYDENNTETKEEIVEVEKQIAGEEISTEEVDREMQDSIQKVPIESSNEVDESADTSPNKDEETVHDESVVGFPQVSATTTYSLVNEESKEQIDTNEIDVKPMPTDEQIVTEITEATMVTAHQTVVSEVESSALTVEDVLPEQNVEPENEVFEEISTSTEIVMKEMIQAEHSSASSSVPTTPTRESAALAYSFDGVEWFPLGDIKLLTDTQISFDLGEMSIDAIPSLRIRVMYVAPFDAPEILFQNPQLQLRYVPGEVIEVPIGPSDQEPHFDSSFVMTDITSENIRVILLERGGMLELWYSVTDKLSGKALWRKLSGGGDIEEGSPIGIKKRTIFWFDRNQETLFGFSVDSGLTFAVSYTNPDYRVFRLPFETKNEEQWEVMYDPTDNVLLFEQMYNNE